MKVVLLAAGWPEAEPPPPPTAGRVLEALRPAAGPAQGHCLHHCLHAAQLGGGASAGGGLWCAQVVHPLRCEGERWYGGGAALWREGEGWYGGRAALRHEGERWYGGAGAALRRKGRYGDGVTGGWGYSAA